MNAKQMVRVSVVGLVAVIGLAVSSAPAHAQFGERKKGDARVATSLDEVGLKYFVDDDGDYILGFDRLGSDEMQIVVINSNTTKLGVLEIRQVWSVARISEEPFTLDELRTLLADNNRMPLGAWRTVTEAQKHAAIYAAQVSADSDGRTLMTIALSVAKIAELNPLPPVEKVKESSHRQTAPATPTTGYVAAR